MEGVGTETQQGRGAPSRVVVGRVEPEIDGGRFPAKRVLGDSLRVGAVLVCDGHDQLAGVVRFRRAGESAWCETPIRPLGNDCWEGSFGLEMLGRQEYTVEAWVDDFASWRSALGRKIDAGHEVRSELLEGAALVRAAARRAGDPD